MQKNAIHFLAEGEDAPIVKNFDKIAEKASKVDYIFTMEEIKKRFPKYTERPRDKKVCTKKVFEK